MESLYQCICGKQFNNIKSLCAHKATCKDYYNYRDGNLESYNRRKLNLDRANKNKDLASIKLLYDNKKKQKIDNWVEEKHYCKTCGKLMVSYFGSGQYCSRACANSKKHSEETINKIAKKAKEHGKETISNNERAYFENPNYCIVCGNILDYNKRNLQTCCPECKNKLISNKNKGRTGGLRKNGGRGHSGWYRGYYCDSTWELAWIIYNLDHGIEFKRNTKSYEYIYNNKVYKYYPDFELVDGTLVEIKGIFDQLAKIKIESIKDRNIIVLTKKDLKPIFEYVKHTYGCNKFEELYTGK